jgi:eukaryotic-like serine/threonine-protein kinase
MQGSVLSDLEIVPETFSDFGGLPARVDRYRITGILGTGSMGIVLRARDGVLGREVALKVLRLDTRHRSDLADDASRSVARARFLHEAQLMARLNHPNVVPIYDVGPCGEQTYLAMELVEGETLEQWLRPGRTRDEIVEVFVQAAQGLAAAHRAGVVHRDFKPNNVLVGRDGRVRVMDFGLATLAGFGPGPTGAATEATSSQDDVALTQVGMSVGTPAYMPPEQHYGRALDGRSDQFALCCALHEALHGVRPFHGTSAEELLQAKLDRRLRRARRVPGWLNRIIERGTSPSPDRRFVDMMELLDALRRSRRSTLVRRGVLALAMVAVIAGAAVPVVAVGASRLAQVDRHAAKDAGSADASSQGS